MVLCFTGVWFDFSRQLFGDDVLSSILYESSWFVIDYWSFLHLIFFGFIPGATMKGYLPAVITITTMWEVLEYMLSNTLKDYTMAGVWEERFKNAMSDLVFNSVGMLLGIYLVNDSTGSTATVQAYLKRTVLELSILFGSLVLFDLRYPGQLTWCLLLGTSAWLVTIIIRFSYPTIHSVTMWVTQSWIRRLMWAGVETWLVVYLYHLVQINTSPNVIQTSTTLDDWVPFIPSTIVYVFGFIFQILFGLVIGDSRDMCLFWICGWLLLAPALLVFLLFPLGVARPRSVEWSNQGTFVSDVFNWVRSVDDSHNSLPSLHAGVSTLFYLAHRNRPGQSTVHLLLWTIIVTSTLTTKKHTAVDVLSGCGFAVLALVLGEHLFSGFEDNRLKKKV